MKKYIIAGIALVLILGGGWLEQSHIQKTFTEFETKIDAAAAGAHAQTVTDADMENLRKWWQDKKCSLDIMVPHANITEIDMHLYEAVFNVKSGQYEDAYAQIGVLKSLAFRVKELLSR